jgi:hypothetical protein
MSSQQAEKPAPVRRMPAPMLPRWLGYWLGAAAAALGLAILTLWGLHGPGFMLDHVSAYCF